MGRSSPSAPAGHDPPIDGSHPRLQVPVILATLAVGFCLAAQTPAPAAVPVPPAFEGRGKPSVSIPRVEAAIAVDGSLDEPVWSQAVRLTGFWQYRPVDGRPAEERTEVLVWYSPTALHFGILAFDSNPQSVRATVADRDNLSRDDTVTIYLDTFNDRRRAYFFTLNPLGVQEDGVQSEGAFNPGNSVRRKHRPQSRLPVRLEGAAHLRGLHRGGARAVQESAVCRKRTTALGHQRAPQGAADRVRGHLDRRPAGVVELPGAVGHDRGAARSEARSGGRGPALRHRRLRRRAQPAIGPVRPRLGGLRPRRQRATRGRKRRRRPDGQPRFQPGRVGCRAGHRQPALRPLLRREAAILPRRHRAVRHAEPTRLHAPDCRSDRRRKVHRQVRPLRRRLSRGPRRGERGGDREHDEGPPRHRRQLDCRRHVHGQDQQRRLQPRDRRRHPAVVQEALLRAGPGRTVVDRGRRPHPPGANLDRRVPTAPAARGASTTSSTASARTS